MSELIADLFVSLDGFARADGVGPYFGYGGPQLERWIEDELERPQVVVLGRVTYELLGPVTAAASDPMSKRLTAVPKIVVSSTLSNQLEWDNTSLLEGDATAVLTAVKAESQVPLRTMGSVSLVRSLVEAGLVDRLRLMVFPIVCGSAGSETIFAGGHLQRLELVSTTVLDDRVVLLEYTPA